jgi:hypothetical protein
MGQQGKKGGEKAGKYQGKDKRRKNITIMYKICRKEGGRDQRGRSKETGRELYNLLTTVFQGIYIYSTVFFISCLQLYFRAYIFTLLYFYKLFTTVFQGIYIYTTVLLKDLPLTSAKSEHDFCLHAANISRRLCRMF